MTHVLLEPTAIIQEGDEKLSQFAPYKWLGISKNWIGQQVGDTIMRRPVPKPQWQEGEIPKPKCLCALILQRVDGAEAWVSIEIPRNGYEWMMQGRFSPEYCITEFPDEYTGRWYIQTITLPQQ